MDEKSPARGGKAPSVAADAQGPFPSRSLSRRSFCHATLAETLRVSGSSSRLSACHPSLLPQGDP